MASRSMGTVPMTLSLVASFMSAITLLGTPAEMYVSGTQYAALVLSYPLVMGATAHGFLPVFDQLQVGQRPPSFLRMARHYTEPRRGSKWKIKIHAS